MHVIHVSQKLEKYFDVCDKNSDYKLETFLFDE